MLAVLLYRRRQLEKAGDLLAVHWAMPVFLLILTLGGGILFYLFADLFSYKTGYLFLFAGMAVGFFAGKMLLSRKVKVFTLRIVGQFAVLSAVMLVSLFLTGLDPLHVTTRVPEAEQVKSAVLYSGPRSDEYDDATTAGEIEQIRQIHSLLVQDGRPADRRYDGSWIYIRYHLDNGREILRRYDIFPDTSVIEPLREYSSNWQRLLRSDDLEESKRRFSFGTFDLWQDEKWSVSLSQQQIAVLLDAVVADCEAGNMGQMSVLHDREDLSGNIDLLVQPENPGQSQYGLSIKVYPSCTHTMSVLREIAQEAEQTYPDTKTEP